jgi:hypothetical protein
MSERTETTLRRRAEFDALIIKSLGWGVALLLFYFTLDAQNNPESSIWPGLIGALVFAGLGHLVSWAIARIPAKPGQREARTRGLRFSLKPGPGPDSDQ